jgi:hypothetical protein
MLAVINVREGRREVALTILAGFAREAVCEQAGIVLDTSSCADDLGVYHRCLCVLHKHETT